MPPSKRYFFVNIFPGCLGLRSASRRIAVLICCTLSLGKEAAAQIRGKQAAQSTPATASSAQPAPLPPAQLEEALRLLLRADSLANKRVAEGAESQGLVLDQTITKLGHDFYDRFYNTFEAPVDLLGYTILVAERPARGNSSLVVLTVNDMELLEMPLPTQADQMEEIVAGAVEAAQGFLRESQSVSRQLESGQKNPPERF